MTENLAVDRIYCGDMTELQPPLRPVIRIYLSSNFTDMVMEKTELVNHIFPIIRNYCKDRHGLDFQVELESTKGKVTKKEKKEQTSFFWMGGCKPFLKKKLQSKRRLLIFTGRCPPQKSLRTLIFIQNLKEETFAGRLWI